MGESINTAILVTVVGMFTVFVILGLVVLTGKVLIRIVNTFFPITEAELTPSITPKVQKRNKSFDKSTLAAIVSTIDTITYGNGKVDKIERIN
jgi:oxaloacetate decarboxylase (Na+ extruding) subunit gamma